MVGACPFLPCMSNFSLACPMSRFQEMESKQEVGWWGQRPFSPLLSACFDDGSSCTGLSITCNNGALVAVSVCGQASRVLCECIWLTLGCCASGFTCWMLRS